MSRDPDRVLSDFVDAWNAGRRPRVDDYLALVAPELRGELADQIGTFLEIAQTPDHDAAARAEIRAEPALLAAYARIGEPVAPAPLPVLRRRAGLGLGDLARRLAGGFGLDAAQEERAERYLRRLEAGKLDPRRVSRRLLDALGAALGVAGEELARALSAGSRPVPAEAASTLFRAEPGSADAVGADLDALSRAAMAPAPPPMDELDRLFCGGPDA